MRNNILSDIKTTAGQGERRCGMEELIERYGISEMVVLGENEYPLLDVPMMSDETWNRLSRENAVHTFTVRKGREPVNVEEALVWQRTLVAEALGKL